MLSQLSSSDTNISVNIINRERGLYAIKLDKKSLVTNDWNGLTYRLRSSLYTLDRFDKYVTLNKHQGCVNCLNFNKAGNILVTGSDDLKIILWDWARQRPLHVKQTGHRSNVFQAKFVDSMGANNMNDFRLATSARDGEVRYITVAPCGRSTNRLLYSHEEAVHKLAIFDSDPYDIYSAGEDGKVVHIDIRLPDNCTTTTAINARIGGPPIALYSIAAHPSKPEFCVSGRDKFVRVYDKRYGDRCLRKHFASEPRKTVSECEKREREI